jgi:PIN domain nuclease of toxin-antitoxin system
VIERLLLDTHAPLWALTSPGRLPGRVAKAIRATETDFYVSPVATWEIAIKSVLGKINADVGIVAGGAAPHTSTSSQSPFAHTLRLALLPGHHRDPFDRLLAAQAIEERLTLVTHNPAIARYPVTVLWG